MNERIHLLLLVDFALVRESLSRQLRLEEGIEVTAECGTCGEALEAIGRSPVDVFLFDQDALGGSAAEFIEAARTAGYAGKFLVLAAEKPANGALTALRAGASGLFRKHSPFSSLPRAIRQVAAGETWLEFDILQQLVGSMVMEPDAPNVYGVLSSREQQVLEGVLDGLTNKAIAGRVGLSEGVVKKILREIFRKAGVRRRSQLVSVALTRKARFTTNAVPNS